MTLEELNGLDHAAAERELLRCCGSTRWAAALVGRRPFRDLEEVMRVAEETWWKLEGGDWLEAFSHHPRIGDRAEGFAGDEQAAARSASAETLRRLAEMNRAYERKFGHVFLIFATGRTADEMLAHLERRLANDPARELAVAAAEQARITRLRLERLVAPPRSGAA